MRSRFEKNYRFNSYTPSAGEDRSISEKDDGGLTSSSRSRQDEIEIREKLSLQLLYHHAPARIVPSAERRWGWVNGLPTFGSRHQSKKYRFRSYTPYQRLLCGKLFSFVQVLVVHLMSWLAHLAEPMV